MCGLCISQNHRSDHHTIVSASLAQHEKRDRLDEAMGEMNMKLNERFNKCLTGGVVELLHLTTRATRLSALSEDLFKIVDTISSPAVGIEKITTGEKKLQELQRRLEDIESEPLHPSSPTPTPQSSGHSTDNTTTGHPEEESSSKDVPPNSSQS